MTPPDGRDFLVISRGQWDAGASDADIQAAIDAFYDWLQAHVAAGRMRRGSRLTADGATVTCKAVTTDGPFGESKEWVGGYWFVVAPTLADAARLLADSPTLRFGLRYEVRPLDPEAATATIRAAETLARLGAGRAAG